MSLLSIYAGFPSYWCSRRIATHGACHEVGLTSTALCAANRRYSQKGRCIMYAQWGRIFSIHVNFLPFSPLMFELRKQPQTQNHCKSACAFKSLLKLINEVWLSDKSWKLNLKVIGLKGLSTCDLKGITIIIITQCIKGKRTDQTIKPFMVDFWLGVENWLGFWSFLFGV